MSVTLAYVLSTRTLSAALIEEAATKGITIDVAPFINTEKLEDKTVSLQLAELAKRPVTAIFTSTNAVTAMEKKTGSPNWKIFCLSGATHRAAAERFGENRIAGVADSAKELAEAIISRETTGECWFFCGDKRREELPDRLKAAGWQVHELVVYRTILTPIRIDKPYDAIVFFSPSAVESFFSMNTIGSQVRLFAIGRTTAAAIGAICPNPVVISERPDEQILIKQLINSFDEHTQK
jgi:uroporphyrinogen-III synthase